MPTDRRPGFCRRPAIVVALIAQMALGSAPLVANAAVQTLPNGVDRVDADLNPIAPIDGVDNRIPVNVAILDSGIDATHPDLQVVGGKNCVPDFNSALTDPNGHGTATAGVVGALDNTMG